MYIYICIYLYILHMYIYIYIYTKKCMYIYIYRERVLKPMGLGQNPFGEPTLVAHFAQPTNVFQDNTGIS